MRKLLPLLLLSACNAPDDEVDRERELAAGGTITEPEDLAGQQTMVGFDLIVVDESGEPIACEDAGVTLDVRVSFDDGATWTDVPASNAMTICSDEVPPDLAIVLDNSGSQDEVIEETRVGAQDLVDGVLALGGEAAIVRVSTVSEVLSPLTSDPDELTDALGLLAAHGGWTALYDGMRMGAEELGRALGRASPRQHDTLQEFCEDHDRFGVVAFTNGEDNNSAGERLWREDDDGIDTTPADLVSMTVGGVPTAMHVLGMGPRVRYDNLVDISEATGGRFVPVADEASIPDAFALVRRWIETTTHGCVDVPQLACGPALLDVTWTRQTPRGPWAETTQIPVHVACPVDEPTGSVLTMLMSLTDEGISAATADGLVEDALARVRPPDASTRNLVVIRDDATHGLGDGDADLVAAHAALSGWTTKVVDEPASGVTVSDLVGADVVWLSNPGWPMDDLATFEALRLAAAQGAGVVLQGDDMTWAAGHAFPLDPLTGLSNESDGVLACGTRLDDGAAAAWSVTPVSSAELRVGGFTYGDDLDESRVVDDRTEVLAWARPAVDGCDTRVPAVVLRHP